MTYILSFIYSIEDLLSEQAILKWYDHAHMPDRKAEFLAQMKRMVDWLNTAEEESDNGKFYMEITLFYDS